MPPIDFAERLKILGSHRYTKLRDPQAAALAAYAEMLDAPDVAIELPTGYGKTLVALLIADYALESGRRVAYLTGNNQLTDQVLEQAADLPGVDAVRFSGGHYPPADLAAYHDAQVVGVMNYWTYFNSSPKVEPADILILDDAHLAEQPLAGMFSIRIDGRTQTELYDDICDQVLAHTDLYPTVRLMRENAAGNSPPELLAFPHWSKVAVPIADLLTARLSENDRRFTWPTVHARLHACGVLIGPSAIEIRPYHPPTRTLNGYQRARQRIYLSATLGTMDDLQRRLGAGKVASVLPTPVVPNEVGERLFVLNPSEDDALSDRCVTFVLDQAQRAGRAAWLCASHAEADAVEAMLKAQRATTYRLRSGSDDSPLDRWISDARGHLITAGRYDGLDFAGDKCRLVVLPSVPAASTEFERFVMAYLGDATYMRHRVGQRVTQALGRANRRPGDWAMYVGLSPAFGQMLAQSGVQSAIPADVRPDIDLAMQRMEGGWERARSDADDFWTRGGTPRATPVVVARRRPGRSRAAATAGSADDEVTAVTRLWLGDAAGAATAAAAAAETLSVAGEVEHAAFWRYVQAQGHAADGRVGDAIGALREAVEAASNTAWFSRLRKILAELRGEQARIDSDEPWTTWDAWVRSAGPARIGRAIAVAREAFVSGTHDQQCEALTILGRMVGASAERPDGSSATDVVWTWTEGTRLERRLWEVKTGTPEAVKRDWINQAVGQLAAHRASTSIDVSGCLVTSLIEIEEDAAQAARDQLAVIHRDALVAMIDRLGNRLRRYAELWGGGDAAARGTARETLEPDMPSAGWLKRLLGPSQGRIVTVAEVEGELRATS